MCRRLAAALVAAGLCWCVLAAGPAAARLAPPAPAAPAEHPPGAAAQTPAGSADLAALPLDDLLQHRGAAAAGELERRFAVLTDKLARQRIAVVLLSRRQADQPYFDYLADFARREVASGEPFPYSFDRQGKIVVPARYSAAFLSWTASHQADPGAAAAKAFQEHPMDFFLLALSGDRRAIPIFLQGLDAANYLVVYRSAWGLARLHYVPAVRPIIAAADRQAGEASELIARTLVLFADPEAQAAASRLIPDKQLLAALRTNAERELTVNIGDP